MGGRASADLVRTGEDAAPASQAVFDEPRGSSTSSIVAPRDHTRRAAAVRSSTIALVTAAALKELTSPLVELHGQHEHQTLLDPQSHLDCSTISPASTAARATSRARSASGKRLQTELDALAHGRAREGGTRRPAEVSARRDRASASSGRARTKSSRRRAAGAGERRQAAAACAARRMRRSTTATTRRSRARCRLETGGRAGRRRPAFQPYLDARDAIKSQLEDLASSCASMPTTSTRRRRGCRRSKIASRCSSG